MADIGRQAGSWNSILASLGLTQDDVTADLQKSVRQGAEAVNRLFEPLGVGQQVVRNVYHTGAQRARGEEPTLRPWFGPNKISGLENVEDLIDVWGPKLAGLEPGAGKQFIINHPSAAAALGVGSDIFGDPIQFVAANRALTKYNILAPSEYVGFRDAATRLSPVTAEAGAIRKTGPGNIDHIRKRMESMLKARGIPEWEKIAGLSDEQVQKVWEAYQQPRVAPAMSPRETKRVNKTIGTTITYRDRAGKVRTGKVADVATMGKAYGLVMKDGSVVLPNQLVKKGQRGAITYDPKTNTLQDKPGPGGFYKDMPVKVDERYGVITGIDADNRTAYVRFGDRITRVPLERIDADVHTPGGDTPLSRLRNQSGAIVKKGERPRWSGEFNPDGSLDTRWSGIISPNGTVSQGNTLYDVNHSQLIRQMHPDLNRRVGNAPYRDLYDRFFDEGGIRVNALGYEFNPSNATAIANLKRELTERPRTSHIDFDIRGTPGITFNNSEEALRFLNNAGDDIVGAINRRHQSVMSRIRGFDFGGEEGAIRWRGKPENRIEPVPKENVNLMAKLIEAEPQADPRVAHGDAIQVPGADEPVIAVSHVGRAEGWPEGTIAGRQMQERGTPFRHQEPVYLTPEDWRSQPAIHRNRRPLKSYPYPFTEDASKGQAQREMEAASILGAAEQAKFPEFRPGDLVQYEYTPGKAAPATVLPNNKIFVHTSESGGKQMTINGYLVKRVLGRSSELERGEMVNPAAQKGYKNLLHSGAAAMGLDQIGRALRAKALADVERSSE